MKKYEFESNFSKTPTGGLKLNQQLVQLGSDPMIQFGPFSRCVLKVTFKLIFCDESPICGT